MAKSSAAPATREIPEGFIQDKRPRYGWMDSVDFDHELGEAMGGNVIYPDEADLRENRTCLDTDGHCTAIEVVVFRVTPSSTFWQADSGKVFPCGHSKWDADHNCLTCNQETVNLLNATLAKERTKSTAHQALYEALSALWAGVSDARRKLVGTGANNPEVLIQLPVLWGAIEKMAAALALADAAQGEK